MVDPPGNKLSHNWRYRLPLLHDPARVPANEGNLPEKSSRQILSSNFYIFPGGAVQIPIGCRPAARDVKQLPGRRLQAGSHALLGRLGFLHDLKIRKLQSLLANVMAEVSSTTNFSISSPSNISHLESQGSVFS
ncbi:hypothetical protein WP1_065 [Pseudomonas phage WP1]